MKIEGLGEFTGWVGGMGEDVTPADLRVGKIVNRHEPGDNYNSWVITDVLGDGKFKAVSKRTLDETIKQLNADPLGSRFEWPQDRNIILEELKDSNPGIQEQFDISGKVDTQNAIYKFYEKGVGKYLTKKYGATRITDPQGVTWWEIEVPEAAAKAPVHAFATDAH
jgi:hypothetical protein